MFENPARTIAVTGRGLESLSQNPLSKVEGLILWHLISSLPPTGGVVSKAQLEVKLAVSDTHINRGMKRLCEIGHLIRGPKVGLSFHYKLNPAFFRILS